MAELRTIQQAEIRDFVGVRYLLALGDQYSVIPNPLQALGRPLRDSEPPSEDQHILVIGPTGLHLLSYHLVYREHRSPHFVKVAKQLEHSAALLFEFLSRFVSHVPPFQLSIVVQDGNMEGEATSYVAFVPWSQVRSYIESAPLQLQPEEIKTLLDILKADMSFQRVDRYHILSELERTPEQVKYLAVNTVNDHPVLLKEITLPYDPDQLARHAVVRGAKVAQKLLHENIVQVEKLIPQEERCYIVSEWCEGAISLRQYMNKHPGDIPLTTAIQLIKDLCQAVMYAHNQGVIHRNLNPENMLVTPGHRLKVLNFDVAKNKDMHTLQTSDFKKLTRENPYCAPEYMIGSHQLDQRVDVYSIGVVFYELLTGGLPSHYDESRWEPPSYKINGLPGYMDGLIARSIRFDKDHRFSTVHAFYSALEKGVSDKIGARYLVAADALPRAVSVNSLVYQALDTQTQKHVALKKILMPPITHYQARQQELRQSLEPLDALKSLKHPGLVSLRDTLIEHDDAYVVMDWIEGRNLRVTLEKRPQQQGLLPEEVRQIGVQLAAVLSYIHKQGYVHGDIKPENVMLSEGWRVTLLDFMPWSKAEQDLSCKVPHTMRYMAPELLSNSGQSPNESTDIFALGVLMYELLVHRFPYDVAQLREDRLGQILKPEPLPEDIPESLSRAIYKALSTNPRNRYHTFTELQAHLESERNLVFQAPDTLYTPTPPSELQDFQVPEVFWKIALLTCFLWGVYCIQSLARLSYFSVPVIQEVFYE